MLKDITIGQYFDGSSFIHRLEARSKIIMTLLFIIMLFLDSRFFTIEFGLAYTLIYVYLSHINIKIILKSVKPVLPILILTAILNIFFIDSGTEVFSWYFIHITDRGISNSVFMIIRIILLIIGCSMLTYTTTPIALTDAIEKLFSPLKRLKFPVHEMAMMMTIALRFIPTIINETDRIISAQKSRGADFENGSTADKLRSIKPILFPLFISSFRRANELASAMECRCYRVGSGRTRMKQSVFHAGDFISIFITFLFIAGIIIVKLIIKINGGI